MSFPFYRHLVACFVSRGFAHSSVILASCLALEHARTLTRARSHGLGWSGLHPLPSLAVDGLANPHIPHIPEPIRYRGISARAQVVCHLESIPKTEFDSLQVSIRRGRAPRDATALEHEDSNVHSPPATCSATALNLRTVFLVTVRVPAYNFLGSWPRCELATGKPSGTVCRARRSTPSTRHHSKSSHSKRVDFGLSIGLVARRSRLFAEHWLPSLSAGFSSHVLVAMGQRPFIPQGLAMIMHIHGTGIKGSRSVSTTRYCTRRARTREGWNQSADRAERATTEAHNLASRGRGIHRISHIYARGSRTINHRYEPGSAV